MEFPLTSRSASEVHGKESESFQKNLETIKSNKFRFSVFLVNGKEEIYARLINDLTDVMRSSKNDGKAEKVETTTKNGADQKRELLSEIKDLLTKTSSQLDDDLPVKKDASSPFGFTWRKKGEENPEGKQNTGGLAWRKRGEGKQNTGGLIWKKEGKQNNGGLIWNKGLLKSGSLLILPGRAFLICVETFFPTIPIIHCTFFLVCCSSQSSFQYNIRSSLLLQQCLLNIHSMSRRMSRFEYFLVDVVGEAHRM